MNDHLSEPGGKVRLFVEAALGSGVRVQANDAQAHYLLHVMRAKGGDRILLFNGHDGEWLAQITDVTKRGCIFACERQTRAQVNTPDLWLCFAPIKKTPSDYLTQKATELGVSALQPVITRRTIVSRMNTERMRANAIEAAEQSDRLSVPEIREPVSLEKLFANWPAERRILFCDEAGDALPIGEQVTGIDGAWAVLTGPEGGFDPAEREAIRLKPFVTPVSLGPRILRADTAALAALAVWQALAGDWH